MEQWEITGPLGQCSGSGRKIEPGEEYYAALVETEQGLQRRDFCAEYWNSHKPEVYCYWKTKLPDPNKKRQIFVDDDMLMTFFDRLENETDPEKINFRFVLALVLLRHRKLKYDSSKSEDGIDKWRLRITGTDSYVEVIDPHLDESQIEQLSSQIGRILQVEL